ncbi:MAG: hypothetical protein K6E75_00505 [Lachnospiraceae bacterium]|nr:hypothetical protein [Lachnospiraceae bacterium]
MPFFKTLSKEDFQNELQNAGNDANALFENGLAKDGKDKDPVAFKEEKRAFLVHCIASTIDEDFFCGQVINGRVDYNPSGSEFIDQMVSQIDENNLESSQRNLIDAFLDELEGDAKNALDDVLEHFSPEDMWQVREVLKNALIGGRLIPHEQIKKFNAVSDDNKTLIVREEVENREEIDAAALRVSDSKGILDSYISNAKEGKPLAPEQNRYIRYVPEEQIIEQDEKENEKPEDTVYADPKNIYPVTRKTGSDLQDVLREFGRTNTPLSVKKDDMLTYLYRNKSEEEFGRIVSGIQNSPEAQKIVNDLAGYATLDDLTKVNQESESLAEDLEAYLKNPMAMHMIMRHVDRMKTAYEKAAEELQINEDLLKNEIKEEIIEIEEKEENKEENKEKDKEEEKEENIIILKEDEDEKKDEKEDEKEDTRDPKEILREALADQNAGPEDKQKALVKFLFAGKEQKEDYDKAIQNLGQRDKKETKQMQDLLDRMIGLSDQQGFEERLLDETCKNLLRSVLLVSPTSMQDGIRMSRKIDIFQNGLKKQENGNKEEYRYIPDEPGINLINVENDKDQIREKSEEEKIFEADEPEKTSRYKISKNTENYQKGLDRFNTKRLGIFKQESDKHKNVRLAANYMMKIRAQADNGFDGQMGRAVSAAKDERSKMLIATQWLYGASRLNYQAGVYIRDRNPLTFAGADRYGGARDLEKFSSQDIRFCLQTIEKEGLDLKAIQKAIAQRQLKESLTELKKIDFTAVRGADPTERAKLKEVIYTNLTAAAAIEVMDREGADPAVTGYFNLRKSFDRDKNLSEALDVYVSEAFHWGNVEVHLSQGAKGFIDTLKETNNKLQYGKLTGLKKEPVKKAGKHM